MNVSASSLQRVLACIPSAILPHSGRITPEATRGHVLHDFLRNVSAMGREEALALVAQEHRPAAEALELSDLPSSDPDAYAAEVAFLVNVREDTAREVGRNIGRNYPPHEAWEIPGTADVVGVTPDSVIVMDFKSGWTNYGPVERNAQLRFLALAAARAYGRSRAQVAIIRLGDGEPRFERAELDEMDLEAVAAELRELMERLEQESIRMEAGHRPRTVEGPHCRYCPAFAGCPAKVTLALALSGSVSPVPALTHENAPQVLERLEAAEAVLRHVRAVVDDYAKAHPIHLPSGEVYGQQATERDTIDPAKASAILAERFDARVAMNSVKTESTFVKDRLKAALRTWKAEHPGAKLSHLEREAMEALRAGGAVRTSTFYTMRRFRPDPELAAGFEPVQVAALPEGSPAEPAPEEERRRAEG